MRKELPGNSSPGSYGAQKTNTKTVLFLAHGSQWEKWDTSAPGGHEAMSGDICGCHNGGAAGIEGVGLRMAAPPPQRVTCPMSGGRGWGKGRYGLVLRSEGTPSSLLQSQIRVITAEGKMAA